MHGVPSPGPNVAAPSSANLPDSKKVTHSWVNRIANIVSLVIAPLSIACSSMRLPRSPREATLCMLDNITDFLGDMVCYDSVATAPGTIIGAGAHLLAAGERITEIRKVQPFLDGLPALAKYCFYERQKISHVVGGIRKGLRSPEESIAMSGGRLCDKEGNDYRQQYQYLTGNLASMRTFLHHPEWWLLEVVEQVFPLNNSQQQPDSIDEMAFRARKALALLEQRKAWVEKFYPRLVAFNKRPPSRGHYWANKQKKWAKQLSELKVGWNVFIKEWLRLADGLRRILNGLAESRTHSNPLLPLLTDALPLAGEAVGEVYEQYLQLFSGKRALSDPHYLFGSDKNHESIRDDEFPEPEPQSLPKPTTIQITPEQQTMLWPNSVSLAPLIEGLTARMTTLYRGIENINLFPLLFPLAEGAGLKSDLLTTPTPADIGLQHPEMLIERTNTTAAEEKIKSIIWRDLIAKPPITKMLEYQLLYRHPENIRLLSLRDNLINIKHATTGRLLNAYIGMYQDVRNNGFLNVSEYELSIFARTLVRGGSFGVSPEQLKVKISNLSEKDEWLSSLFFRGIRYIDRDILTYAQESFYNKIKGNATIADLQKIKKDVLSSLPVIKPSLLSGDAEAVKHRRHQNEQAEKFRQLNPTQLAAIRHIIDRKISDLFPLTKVNFTDGVKKENHPYLDYRVLSLEGTMLNFGAACAEAYGFSISLNEDPHRLPYIALLTLLNAEAKDMPPDSNIYFKLYDEDQAQLSGAAKINLKSNGLYSSFGGLEKLLRNLKQIYHLSNKLFTAHVDFAVAMKGLDKGNIDANNVTMIREKFTNSFSELCARCLHSLPLETKNYIEKAVLAGTLRVKANRLILTINSEKNNIPLNVGSIITIQNLEGVITRAYLLSPSMIITDLVNSGICEIPIEELKVKNINDYVDKYPLYLINKLIPHLMHKNKQEDYEFTISEIKQIRPLLISGSDWVSQVSNFTAENTHVTFPSMQEKSSETLPEPEAFKWFNIQPDVSPLFPLLPQDSNDERREDSLVADKLVNIVNFFAGLLPFSGCVSTVEDLIKITVPANEEHHQNIIFSSKIERIKITRNYISNRQIKIMVSPDDEPHNMQEITSSATDESLTIMQKKVATIPTQTTTFANEEREEEVAVLNDGISCVADLMTLGTEHVLQDLQKIAEKAGERITLKHILHLEHGPAKMKESATFKNHKENIWRKKLRADESLAPFVRNELLNNKQNVDTFTLRNVPKESVYSGMIYNVPDGSLTMVFKVGNEEKMYSVDGTGDLFIRKSDRYERKYRRNKISGKQLDNMANKFIHGHATKENLYQAVKEELQWQHLNEYALQEGVFSTTFPQAKKSDNHPDLYHDKESKDNFLKRNDGYIRLEKNNQENSFIAVGENAPADLNLKIKPEQDGSYHVVDNKLIKVRTIDEALNSLEKSHQEKPVFKSDVFMSMIGPDENLQLTQTHVLLSPYQYGDLSKNGQRFIQVLEDKNGNLHYRIGPDEEGHFVPLDDEQSASVFPVCRDRRAGASQEGCVKANDGQNTLSSDTTQRIKELDNLYQKREEYRNSESTIFRILQSYQVIDELRSEININDDIKSIIDNHPNLEGVGVVENWSNNGFFSSLIEAGEYFLIRGDKYWKEVVKKNNPEEKDLAEKISGIVQALLDAKNNKIQTEFETSKKEYQDKYLEMENEVWDKALSDMKTGESGHEINGKEIEYDEDANSLYKKLGRASDEDFSREYPEIKAIIDDGVKKTKALAKNAMANGRKDEDFWRSFKELTGISSENLSRKIREDIKDKFDTITQLSSELMPENIEVIEQYNELTAHHLHDISTNPLRKEMEIFGGEICGYVQNGEYPIHVVANNVKIKDLKHTFPHEVGHVLGDRFFDMEVYADLDTNILSGKKQNLPALVKTLCHSPLALAHYLKLLGEKVGIVFKKVGRSVMDELNHRYSEVADLKTSVLAEDIKQIDDHTARITELEKVIDDLATTLRTEEFNNESIDELVKFIFAPGNEQHRAAGWLMYPDIFATLMQHIAGHERVKRWVNNGTSQHSDATLSHAMTIIGQLARWGFSSKAQMRDATPDKALLSVQFFPSPSAKTSTDTTTTLS